MRTQFNRRSFIKASAFGSAGLLVLRDSRSVGAYHANEKLNIAIIGACGQGESNTMNVAGENLARTKRRTAVEERGELFERIRHALRVTLTAQSERLGLRQLARIDDRVVARRTEMRGVARERRTVSVGVLFARSVARFASDP